MTDRLAAEALQADALGMLRRLSDRNIANSDPVYAAQLKFTEQTVRVLTEALVGSEVGIGTAHEVLQKYLLGMLPSVAQAQALLDAKAMFTRTMERG